MVIKFKVGEGGGVILWWGFGRQVLVQILYLPRSGLIDRMC